MMKMKKNVLIFAQKILILLFLRVKNVLKNVLEILLLYIINIAIKNVLMKLLMKILNVKIL